ncbi:MAG: DUF106 domain-containing protein [Candidatus Aenigmarchaeota archaeon]|nr:DUF106 domain-containing protein [Candidatus Aenigmarchaeota archaeon]
MPLLPFQELMLISIALALTTSVIYRLFIKPADLRRMKDDMEAYRRRMSEAQKSGKEEETKKFMDEFFKLQREHLRLMMKPMMVSSLIFLVPFFCAFESVCLPTMYENVAVQMPFAIPFLGSTFNWFWWYLITIIPSSFIIRKLLGVD